MTDVYRNLKRSGGCWSIRKRGRVVAHAKAVVLWDVALVVRPGALARLRARHVREICAHARGTVTDAPRPPGALRLLFDPYGVGTFTVDGVPITAAAAAWFETDGTAWILKEPVCAR